jgi:deoxyribose-phosphate aldolase
MSIIESLIDQAKSVVVTKALVKTAIACLDYTSLGDNDTEDNVRTLCQQAMTPLGNVAAICVWPEFVNFAKRTLVDDRIDIATVINFPSGEQALTDAVADTKKAIFDGATEIDVVFPYKTYLAGDHDAAFHYIEKIKSVCGDDILLKVIIESGALKQTDIIAAVSQGCLAAGADFLKTSTGKIATGATLEAAVAMLTVIKNFQDTQQKTIGFKASGGVRTVQDAAAYIHLVDLIFGESWLSPKTFRIGASSLLVNLLDYSE